MKKARGVILLGVLAACGQADPLGTGDPRADASTEAGAGNSAGAAGEAGVGGEAGAPNPLQLAICTSDTQEPPNNLVCTGLYADIASQQLAAGVEAYAPAVPLWSDGAEKRRWISLPPGEIIDNSDPNEWIFPVGTRVWKEFSRAGRRIETRLWQKTDSNYWVSATYAWNSDESAAVRSAGGDIPLANGTYHIPTADECTQCHRGRSDRILGFEQVLLGLAGATGLTLERLIAEKRLSHPPKSTPLLIGDDGTGLAAPALAWLHVNCGTTCHNQNSNAKAWSTGLFMRLDPTLLDGRAVNDFDPLKTTIGVAAVTPAWKGRTRIVAHDPAHSLLFDLITHRGTGKQMPPIATSVVDAADVPLVEAWIAQMNAPASGGSGGLGGSGGRDGGGGGRGSAGGSAAGQGGSPGGSGGSGGVSAGNGGGGTGGDIVGAGNGGGGTGGDSVSAGNGGGGTGGDGASAGNGGGGMGGDSASAGYGGGGTGGDNASAGYGAGGTGGDNASAGYGGDAIAL